MQKNIIDSGELFLNQQMLTIENKTINILKIDSLNVIKMKRYPLLNGVKLWFKGFLILILLTFFYPDDSTINFIGNLYCLFIFLLIGYNLWQFLKSYYGLVIVTSGDETIISSRNKKFIYRLYNFLLDAIHHTRENMIINLDQCLINYGIVNQGNKNKNEVHLND